MTGSLRSYDMPSSLSCPVQSYGGDTHRAAEMFIRWYVDESDTNSTHISLSIQCVLDQQFWIGWDQFVRGQIGTLWAMLRSEYFADLKVRQTGQKWASLLIMADWDFFWSMCDNGNKIMCHLDV
jgi:hypothetical protein